MLVEVEAQPKLKKKLETLLSNLNLYSNSNNRLDPFGLGT